MKKATTKTTVKWQLLKLATCLLLLMLGFEVKSQVSGTKTIGIDYTTIQLAIADLNSVGVGPGGATINVPAGYTETAPSGGFILGSPTLNASLSVANQLIITKSGVGANPLLTAFSPGLTTNSDGIFVINGADFVTIDAINLTEDNVNNLTPTQQMEWGYALVRVDGTDGSQDNTIRNCQISLSKLNFGTPGSAGSHGIFSASVTSSNTAVVVSALSGANSRNKFYSNTISNVNAGIYVNGYLHAVSPYGFYDQDNDIGGASSLTGNSVTNYGSSATSTVVYGIFAAYNNNTNISFNTVANATGGQGLITTTTGYGIFHSDAVNAVCSINNNIVTLTRDASNGANICISSLVGGTGTNTAPSATINNNTVRGIVTSVTALTGAWTLINVSNLNLGSMTIVNNNLLNTLLNSSGQLILIFANNAALNANISNNYTTGSMGRTAVSTAALLAGIYNVGSPASGVHSLLNNNLSNIQCNNTAASSIFGIVYQVGASLNNGPDITISGNTISNITNNGTLGTITGLNNLFGKNNVVDGNFIFNLTNTGSVLGIVAGNTSTVSQVISNNIVRNLTTSQAGAIALIGINGTGAGIANIFKNKVYDCTISSPSNSAAYGIYASGAATISITNIYNNFVGRMYGQSGFVNGITGMANSFTSTLATNQLNIYYNTVYMDATAGTTNCYYSANANGTLTCRNNIFVNNSTGGNAYGMHRAGTSLAAILLNYGAASNNNIFWPTASAFATFINPTVTTYSLAGYQAAASPRENVSKSEVTPFLNTTIGANSNYLHINPAIPTWAENGASNIATYTTDFDADIRQGNIGYLGLGTAPDIGADEGNFTVIPSNDASAGLIYTYGSMVLGYSTNHVITALVSNTGIATIPSFNVTLSISGANTFNSVKAVTGLLPGATQLVTFDPYTPTALGTDNVSVTVQNDDLNSNNTSIATHQITANVLSYKYPGSSNSGGVGFGAANNQFCGKFYTNINASVQEVIVDFTTSGQPYKMAIYGDNAGIPGALLYQDATARSTSIGSAFITLGTNVAIPAGNFYVSIQQLGVTNVGFAYTTENPIRVGSFFSSPVLPTSWTDLSSYSGNFRFNITVNLYLPVPPNCAVSLSPANLSSGNCLTTQLGWASGGGAPTGYRLTFGTNSPNYDNISNNVDLGNVITYNPGTLLPNTTYGYKIVPYNVDGDATGCTFNTFTTGSTASLPFLEDFSLIQFPPTCWNRSSIQYVVRNNVSANGIGTGSVNFDFYNAAIGNYDLTSPVFSNTTTEALSFNFAYATEVAQNDQLELFYSTDQGLTFTSLVVLNGGTNGILNTGGTSVANFVPTAGQWGTYQIALPTGTNMVRFRGISAFGNSLYLDNINISIVPGPSCAINLIPADLATNQAKDATLTWAAGIGGVPTGYDVYLSTIQADVNSSAPAALVSSNQATTSFNTIGLLANTVYYWKVIPKNISGPATGCSVQSFTTGNYFNYCVPTYASGCAVDDIRNVTIKQGPLVLASNTSSCNGAPYYTNYTGLTPASVAKGYSYSISVSFGTDGSQFFGAWIDYDNDGIFAPSEAIALSNNAGSLGTATLNFVVDPAAVTGVTRLRVRGGNDAALLANQACGVSSSPWGETEDYSINIQPAPINEPACATVTASNTSCVTATLLSWPIANNFPTGYTLYFGTDGGGVTPPSDVFFASDLGNVLSVVLPSLTPGTTYYYQVVPYNGNGDALGCTIGSFVSGASVAFTPTVASPYIQNFDGVTQPNLPCGITRSDENFPQDGFTWVTSTLKASTAPNAMAIQYNSNNNTIAKDDWFYSVPLNLTAGKLYRVYFKYAASTAAFPEAFEVFISTAPEASTMLTTSSIYTKNNITNITYISDSSADIIPLVNGVYYVGFHANSAPDEDILFIDDFRVKNIPVSALAPASCTTVNSMYDPIYCNAYPGATNYKYKIENLASSFSYEYTRNLALTDFRLKWAPGVTFGLTYDVSVSAFANGNWIPYGPTCQVTTGPFPTTKLTTGTSCGATISSMSALLTCDSVSAANDYEYRIVNIAQGYDHTWRRVTSSTDYRLSWAYSSTPLVQGLPYGFTYDIQVRALVGKTNLLPGQWGTFGPVCQVTVTGTPQTQLTAPNCGITLSTFTQSFNCIAVAGATDYEWRVSNLALSYSQTGTRTNSSTNYRLDWLPGAGGGIRYATTYDVEVRAKVGGVFGTYGPVCQLTTPASPLTSLQAGYCSNYLLPTFSSQVFCFAVPGATNYRYHITGPSGYDKTFTRNSSVNDWRFNWTVLAPPNQNMVANQTYTVEVASYAGGVWSAYGSACTIVTPAVVPRYGTFMDENPTSEAVNDMLLTVQPNPASASNLSIVMEGIREANTKVQVSIYNMIGKKVYAAEITTDEQSRITLRPETMLAPGVYMTEAIVNGKALRHKFVVE